MQVKLEYTFDMPSERMDMEMQTKASDMYCFISELAQYLRSEIKYKDTYTTEQREMLTAIHGKFWEMRKEYLGDFE